ncbi:MAG: riboflavin synthase [Candidatus Dadabacteria bacterium]|nr:MAG: riboflavin synthase [Candidatus Dadabacteria bacterium]
MFTGIIEDLGTVVAVEPLAQGAAMTVETSLDLGPERPGASIAIDGACMTIVRRQGRRFEVEISAESLRRTTLGERRAGDRVNLELPLRVGDRLGGHIVTGHVDGIGRIAAIREEGESALYTFSLPRELSKLLVEKGSVAVDGISLTCFACREDRFDVAVIPHTAAVTTLGIKKVGDTVNIEADILGKYVERLLEPVLRARVGHTR